MLGGQLHLLLHFSNESLTLLIFKVCVQVWYCKKKKNLSVKISEFSHTEHTCVISTQVKEVQVIGSPQTPSFAESFPKRATSVCEYQSVILLYTLLTGNQRTVSIFGVQFPLLKVMFQFSLLLRAFTTMWHSSVINVPYSSLINVPQLKFPFHDWWAFGLFLPWGY